MLGNNGKCDGGSDPRVTEGAQNSPRSLEREKAEVGRDSPSRLGVLQVGTSIR